MEAICFCSGSEGQKTRVDSKLGFETNAIVLSLILEKILCLVSSRFKKYVINLGEAFCDIRIKKTFHAIAAFSSLANILACALLKYW
jgi:hypothetical protein